MKRKDVVRHDEIVQLYNRLLHRTPNDSEIEYYINEKATFTDVFRAIWESNEFVNLDDHIRSINMAGVEEIAEIYEKFLYRPLSDLEARLYLDNKSSVSDVLKVIWYSDELKNKERELRERRKADKDDIVQIFNMLLLRTPSEQEIDSFQDEKYSKLEVLDIVFRSDEFASVCAAKTKAAASETFILQIYQELLDREASKEEVKMYITNGCLEEDVYKNICTSKELRDRLKKHKKIVAKEFILQAYQSLLGREASKEEMEMYIVNSCSEEDVYKNICTSKELRERFKEQKKVVTEEFIRQVYRTLLGREASKEEADMYIVNRCSEEELCKAICSSYEMKDRLAELNSFRASEQLLHFAYVEFLGRDISQEEIMYYKRNKISDYQVLDIILKSDEYLQKKYEKKATIEEKNMLFDTFLGRPLRDYEMELFKDNTLSELIRIIKNSGEYREYRKKQLREEVMVPKYGAATYKILWDKPTTFSCVYNCSFRDVITTEVRKNRAGFWQEQYELLKYFPVQGTFIDLGANIGVLSCMFESKGWNGYSIEASHKNAECLRKAIQLNNLKIEVGEFAISEKTQILRFLENGPWGMVENELFNDRDNVKDKAFSEVQYFETQAYALDDWEKTGLSIPKNVTYIKMDIEGSEIYALNGMKKFLATYNYPVIYIESNGEALFHFGFTTKDLKKVLSDMGYVCYSWENGKLYPWDETAFQTIYSTDYVCIKDMPDYLKDLVENNVQAENTNKKIMELLSSKLFGEQVHACSELKNYREYLKDNQINAALKDLKKNSRDQVIQKALEWYEIEEENK